MVEGYLYIWNDVESNSVVISGVNFSKLIPILSDSEGIILIKHYSEVASFYSNLSLSYVSSKNLHSLTGEDIYSWGDFYWLDYSTNDFSLIEKDVLSEIKYFSDNAMPMKSANIKGVGNRYIAAAHDDGWYVRLFYACEDALEKLIDVVAFELSGEQKNSLRQGDAFWIQNGIIRQVQKTFDVDAVINLNLNLVK